MSNHLKFGNGIGSHMVLQRNSELPIWGFGPANEKVTVKLGSQQATATVGSDGKWLAKLPRMDAGGPFVLTASSVRESVEATDILIGDVYLASGQSNMEWPVQGANNPKEEIAAANFPQIRHMAVGRLAAPEPLDSIPTQWEVCSPETVGTFTAVGYFFARHLHQTLNVPIGIIHSSWGGTPVEAWTSKAAIDAMPIAQPILDRVIKPDNEAEVMKKFQEQMAGWEAQAFHTDPGNKGIEKNWHKAEFDDSNWRTMNLPTSWEAAGHALDGAFWFRKVIELPAQWTDSDLELSFGTLDDFDDTYFNGEKVGETKVYDGWRVPRNYTILRKLLKTGKNVIAVRVFDRFGAGGFTGSSVQMRLSKKQSKDEMIPLHGSWKYEIELALEPKRGFPPQPAEPLTSRHHHCPSVLYNGMIHPLIPTALAGVIWYQGETNQSRAFQYRTLFKGMINDWRRAFKNPELPFFFVQLANYQPRLKVPDDSSWAELREAQTMALELPKTGMALAIDIGEAADIHPRNKQDVGKRLALAALRVVYGKDIAFSGPMLESVKFEGNKAIVKFKHTFGGLVAKGELSNAFSLAGAKKRFEWAEATIEGDTVVLTSEKVTSPVAVRYAWADNPNAPLYNAAGLPAVPFRTDGWTGLTDNAR